MDDPERGDDPPASDDEDFAGPGETEPEGAPDGSVADAFSGADAGASALDDAGASEPSQSSVDAAVEEVPWVILSVPVACFFLPVPLYCFDVSILFDAEAPESP